MAMAEGVWSEEMGGAVATAEADAGSAGAAPRGVAYAFGWRCFLALLAAVPLIIGVLPPQLGPLAAFRAFDVVGLPKTVAMLVLAGLSLAAFCVSVIRGEAEIRWHRALWVVFALVGWAGVSTLFSASPAVSVWGSYHGNEGLVAVFGYAVVAFLAVQYVRSTSALRTVAIVAVSAACVVSGYAGLQFFGLDPLTWISDAGRAFSTMGNADALGTYLVFPLALAAGLALSAREGRGRVGWWAAAVLIAAGLLASATRGAWIGALAGGLSIGLLGWGGALRLSRGRKLAIGAGAITVAAGAVAAIVAIRPRLAGGSRTLWSLLTSLSNGRTVIWSTGLTAWLTHPITGWGPDGFARAFQSAVGPDWYALVEGVQAAENAHGLPVQALVTLGIPGLVLMVWAIGYAAVASLGVLRSITGRGRHLHVALWGGFIGVIVALLFGTTSPGVSVWLWLAAGLLLALASRPVTAPRRWLLGAVAVLGCALAVWAGSWLVADVVVGRAMQLAPGPDQVSELESAVRLDPIVPTYRWLVADALVSEAVAAQKAGASAQAVDDTVVVALARYQDAAAADPGDALVRTAFANVLVGYAARHPETDAAQRAVEVASQAVSLAPRNPAALAALARAYEVAGRHADAQSTARAARQIAPAYAAQTLGSLGLDTTSTP